MQIAMEKYYLPCMSVENLQGHNSLWRGECCHQFQLSLYFHKKYILWENINSKLIFMIELMLSLICLCFGIFIFPLGKAFILQSKINHCKDMTTLK